MESGVNTFILLGKFSVQNEVLEYFGGFYFSLHYLSIYASKADTLILLLIPNFSLQSSINCLFLKNPVALRAIQSFLVICISLMGLKAHC